MLVETVENDKMSQQIAEQKDEIFRFLESDYSPTGTITSVDEAKGTSS